MADRGSSRLTTAVLDVAGEEAAAEGVSGRVGVDLEVISLGCAPGRLEDARAEADDVVVRFGEVVDPQVEVDLLWR